MWDYQPLNERKMQLSLTFLSWQDGKPLEPVTAGWGADLLLAAIQPAAGSSTETSQGPAGLSTPTQRHMWDFRMATAPLCFSQETEMLLSILPCSMLGEAGMEQEK